MASQIAEVMSPGAAGVTSDAVNAHPAAQFMGTQATFLLACEGLGRLFRTLPLRRGVASSTSTTGSATTGAAKTGPSVLRGLTSAERTTLDDALTPKNLNHIFNPKHNFDSLVRQFGGREGALEQFVRNIGGPLPKSGPYKVVRQIGGQRVIIRGAVVNGVPRIGTAFTP